MAAGYSFATVRPDRESYLSLIDGTFTRIRPRVQPFLLLDWVGSVMYGLDTVIRATTNRTLFPSSKGRSEGLSRGKSGHS
jgi:hypothetical protein